MAQERMDDWMEYARELARAERELRVERWVFISIECKDDAGNPVDVTVTYTEQYPEQMLRYSRQYSTL